MEQLIVHAVCALISIVSLGVAAWVVISGQIQKQGLDSLFLVTVCLLLVVAFLPTPIEAIRKGTLRDALKDKKAKSPEPKPAIAPQKTESSS